MVNKIGGIKVSVCDLLRIALQHLKRLLQSPNYFIQGSAPLSDVLGLAERLQDRLVLVNLLVELGLELVLRHAHQEVADQLRNGLSHCSNRDFEDGIDT